MNDWIIVICDSRYNGADIFKFYGSKDKVKKILVNLVCREKRSEDEDLWDFGVESVENVDESINGNKLYAYANFYDHNVEYTAMTMSAIPKCADVL